MRIDMAEVERLALEHRPKLIVAGWSAYPRQLDFAEFRRIADSVGAYLMVDMAHFAGLVAAGPAPQPGAARPRRHHHHAQDPRRSARRRHPDQRRRRSPRRSTPRSSPASRAARWSTSSPPRRWPSRWRPTRSSRSARSARCDGARILAERLLSRRRRRGRDLGGHRRHRRAPGPGRPARLRPGRAAGARTGCTGSASRSTATRCRSTRARRWSPPGCGSAPRPWPPAASAPTEFTEVADIIATRPRRPTFGDETAADLLRDAGHRPRRPVPPLPAPRPPTGAPA